MAELAELAELAGLALLESLVLALLESLVKQANIPQYEGAIGRIQEESFQLPGVSAKL